MSSADFQADTRTPQGWRRMRVKGHLFEAPVEQRGHRQVTVTSGAVHVPDCPACITGQ